jgi:glutamate formiminotransferase
MTTPLVECIANYSEARRPDVVEAIEKAITSVPSVDLLDRHSDLDHNRTVLTFVGPPVDVEEAAYRSIETAAELINLDEHRGEHPRIGATDVVPFVPISNISMEACVEIARRLGQRVADQLGIPVYLYEEAATRPERKNLENIRRGQYEALKDEIGKKSERARDRGAPSADRLQRVLDHGRRRDRPKDRQGCAPLLRRAAVCQRAGAAGRRSGPGLDEPDPLPAHASSARRRTDPSRG